MKFSDVIAVKLGNFTKCCPAHLNLFTYDFNLFLQEAIIQHAELIQFRRKMGSSSEMSTSGSSSGSSQKQSVSVTQILLYLCRGHKLCQEKFFATDPQSNKFFRFQHAYYFFGHDKPWILFVAGKLIVGEGLDWKDRNDGRLLQRLYDEKDMDFYKARTSPAEKQKRWMKMEAQINMISEGEFNNAPTTHPTMPVDKRPLSDKEPPLSFLGDHAEVERQGVRVGLPRLAPSRRVPKFQKQKPLHQGVAGVKLHPNVQGLEVSSVAFGNGTAGTPGLQTLTFQEFVNMVKASPEGFVKLAGLTSLQLATLNSAISDASSKAEVKCEYKLEHRGCRV